MIWILGRMIISPSTFELIIDQSGADTSKMDVGVKWFRTMYFMIDYWASKWIEMGSAWPTLGHDLNLTWRVCINEVSGNMIAYTTIVSWNTSNYFLSHHLIHRTQRKLWPSSLIMWQLRMITVMALSLHYFHKGP